MDDVTLDPGLTMASGLRIAKFSLPGGLIFIQNKLFME